MSFHVEYSAEARQDLRDIYQYIAYELCAPEAANGLHNESCSIS